MRTRGLERRRRRTHWVALQGMTGRGSVGQLGGNLVAEDIERLRVKDPLDASRMGEPLLAHLDIRRREQRQPEHLAAWSAPAAETAEHLAWGHRGRMPLLIWKGGVPSAAGYVALVLDRLDPRAKPQAPRRTTPVDQNSYVIDP